MERARVREILCMQDRIRQLQTTEDVLSLFNDMRRFFSKEYNPFEELSEHLLSSEIDKRIVREWIIKLITNWKSLWRGAQWSFPDTVFVDVYVICKTVYPFDQGISAVIKKKFLDSDIDLEDSDEVEMQATLSRVFPIAFGVMPEAELIQFRSLVVERHPWAVVDAMTQNNWQMTVVEVQRLLKEGGERLGDEKLQHRIWLWKDRLSKEQVQLAYDSWSAYLSTWLKEYLLKILNSK